MRPAAAVEWAAERARYLGESNLATLVQSAFSEPTAAKLSYAKQAVRQCSLLRSLNPELIAGRSAALAKELERCKDLPDALERFSDQYRFARLDLGQRAILDAADGVGSYRDAPIRVRFEVVAGTADPFLLDRVANAWLARPNRKFDGRPIGEDAELWIAALAVVTCTATGTCDSYPGAARMCRDLGACSGTILKRLEKVYEPEQVESIRAYSTQLQQALIASDFAKFE